MNKQDFERDPCGCGECVQAGVSGLLQKRDPRSGKWLHGYDLKRLYDARESFWTRFKGLASTKGMR